MANKNAFCVTLDVNANILSFEGIATSLSGYTASEVIGSNWFEVFIPESDSQEMLNVFKSFLNGNLTYWEYENKITCKNGDHLIIKWKNSLRRGTDDIPVAIYSEGTPSVT